MARKLVSGIKRNDGVTINKGKESTNRNGKRGQKRDKEL